MKFIHQQKIFWIPLPWWNIPSTIKILFIPSSGCNSYIVEQTKSHCFTLSSVMTGGPHYSKNRIQFSFCNTLCKLLAREKEEKINEKSIPVKAFYSELSTGTLQSIHPMTWYNSELHLYKIVRLLIVVCSVPNLDFKNDPQEKYRTKKLWKF